MWNSGRLAGTVSFALSLLVVLGIHELGHWSVAKYYDVDASPPYFLPSPSTLGTLGAVISIKERVPSRKILFDIAIAGPAFGTIAAIVVTLIGLYLPPIATPTGALSSVELGYPPIIQLLAYASGQPLHPGPGMMVNPIVIAGWVGALITFLNLIPVGELDGGHILRALIWERQGIVSGAVPWVLGGISVYVVRETAAPMQSAIIWVMWTVIALLLVYKGPATPVDDTPLGVRRHMAGWTMFLIGCLCFTPTPILSL